MDGIARLLTKNDVLALQAKSRTTDVERVELELARASALVGTISKQGVLQEVELLEL